MTEIFWVEDFLNGEVLENKYYSTREEAATRRNELGCGFVRAYPLADGGVIPDLDGSDLVAFRASPGEKVEIQ